MVFTDGTMQVSGVEHHPSLGKSEHNVITYIFHCYLDYAKPKAKYGKAGLDAMRRNLLDKNCEEEYIKDNADTSVEDTWQYLKSKLTDLRNRHVPNNLPSTEPSWRDSNSLPINKSLQDAIRN